MHFSPKKFSCPFYIYCGQTFNELPGQDEWASTFISNGQLTCMGFQEDACFSLCQGCIANFD